MTRWFNSWPFHPRSLEVTNNHWKGSLNHPKKVTKTCQGVDIQILVKQLRPSPVRPQTNKSVIKLNLTARFFRSSQENELDFAYWSINGEKRFNESETYGLLQVSSGRGGCGVVLVAGVGGRSFFFNGKEHRLPKRWGKLQTRNDWNI